MSAAGERVERYAELAVRVGANVQEGQEVFLYSIPEHADVARALTRQCYRAGASYVNVIYGDAHVRHAMIGLGPDSALTYAPEWQKQLTSGMDGNALIGTTGNPEPELLADLDGERVGKAMQIEIAKIRRQQYADNSVNWCGVGAPNAGWAQQVLGEPDVERLWELVARCSRLDEDDPVAAWREHLARLDARGKALTEMKPDALHYRGPGTDLTVGLLPTAKWASAGFETAGGIYFVANMPTEEIFTSPDPRRAEGTIRSTMPLSFSGQLIRGLELTFKDGRIVNVDAENGAELIRTQIATVENADRLGELALVTGESRVGQTGTLFYNTLFDENATCHIAFGDGLEYCFDGEPDENLNESNIHVDFMVGGPELEVAALLADGTAVPLIRNEEWLLRKRLGFRHQMSSWDDRTLIEDILANGVRDWVYAGWVYQIAERSGLDDASQLRALSIGLIAELLVGGLAVAGDYDGSGLVPWACSTGDAIARITEAWFAWGESRPTPGAIVWLDVTEAGRQIGLDVLAREQA